MIAAVIQSSTALFIALVCAGLLRKRSAAMRHFVLTAGLAGSLIAPALTLALPRIEWPHGERLRTFVEDRPLIISVLDVERTTAEEPAVSLAAPGGSVFWVWLCGAGLAGFVLLSGSWRIARLGHRATAPDDPRIGSILLEVARSLGLKRRVRLLYNDGLVLGTWGAVQPQVFLPADAGGWSDECLRLVLTHELAHIRRFDWIVQILAECARAVCWFNPLFWLACRRLRLESEHACDDAVLNAGFDAEVYSAQLLELARTLKNSARVWAPVLGMSRRSQLERRFIAMFNTSLTHHALSRGAALLVCALAAFSTLTLATAFTLSAEETSAGVPILSPPAIETPAELGPPAVPAAPPALKARARPAAARPQPQGRADGILSGTVMDPSGAVVPGVMVTVSALQRTANGIREEPAAMAVSDEAGRFNFNALAPGLYSLKAELPGFATFRRTGIEIQASQTSRENVYLSLGNIVQKMEVTVAGQARPPVTPAGPQRIRVGGNVVAANLVSQVKPVYPQSARDAGIEGNVYLQGIIGIDGTFMTLRIVRGNAELANAALEAARQWRYRPAMLNGEPIEVQTEIEMEFRISQ